MVTMYKISKRQRALLVKIYGAKGMLDLATAPDVATCRELRTLGLVTSQPATFPGVGTEATLTLAGVGVAWNLIHPSAGDSDSEARA